MQKLLPQSNKGKCLNHLKSGTPCFAGKLPPHPQGRGLAAPSTHKVRRSGGALNPQDVLFSVHGAFLFLTILTEVKKV